ncbi:MAG TPA: sugar phosphate isomerase/epimerase [Noviherbaspirillum sp.]|uniref:sugar phosphate isomerase/epimerase family protein n=1 Tax=Noviherbaspirillum sp. TaxID=1926288 RepID=UPI002B4A31AF|nr:sugar phosphate isomerase/epimerase [Noviherbaspirillum sp.]HJV84512.1 sugar phosphate isomerase/epimerase [Noviherbaspirillum sp.]
MFVQVPANPGAGRPPFPCVTPAMFPEMRLRLRETGIEVTNLEFFRITSDVVVADYRAALELGAELGAKRAVVHLHDTDEERGLDRLSQFCELAGGHGLAVGLEFNGLSAGCPSLARALEVVERAGCSNLGVGIDPLHLQRTGGKPADLLGVDRRLLSYAQLCDGPVLADAGKALDPARYVADVFDRLVPGEGSFPLAELVRALPADMPFDVEVPALRLIGTNISPRDHARLAVMAARRLLMDHPGNDDA